MMSNTPKKFWFFCILNCWNLPQGWERVIKQQWNVSELCAHKCWLVHTVTLLPAFFCACSHCPKHSQLPSFVQSLRAHLFLLSLQLELRTPRCYHDAQDLRVGWKVTASVSLLSQCKKICNLLSVAGERLPWQRPSTLPGEVRSVTLCRSWSLGIASSQLSWH